MHISLITFKKTYYYLFLILIFSNFLLAEESIISGEVKSAKTGLPLQGANIIVMSSEQGTATDSHGLFNLKINKFPVYLTVSYIGFHEKQILIKSDEVIVISLEPKTISGEDVIVSAIRAVAGITPVAFSTLTAQEIETRYSVEDMPMILAMEPGVYAYSESGNGTGYSYVSIRGFDQSRIAVMLDNVPLNDNESHQVYWVDHGDILSDTKDVQIQRGIGNSLYGSSAFGGSINVLTQIAKPESEVNLKAGYGSYNTQKYRIKINSGEKLGENLSGFARVSSISSEGYRDFHDSQQLAFSTGLEHRFQKMITQFRALVGYENTDLTWDGVYATNINDKEARRESYKAYTDDFLQQIYSLNSLYIYNSKFTFRNVAYFVKGSGYYEVEKNGVNYFEYNLDVLDQYTDEQEQELTSNLLRRKWIQNNYFGIIPTFTYKDELLRIDLGTEMRSYTGNHFGEVTNFSNQELVRSISEEWYKYYDYTGKKISLTGFVHGNIYFTEKLNFMADFQLKYHKWDLNQEKIGHAAGHAISANWVFFNPRFGAMYRMSENISAFVNYGKSHKEPADNQIISADDVFSEPVMVAAESVDDYELGIQFVNNLFFLNINTYRIKFDNEQLKNIDVEQEGEYEYFSADATVHQGLEISANLSPFKKFRAFANASFAQNIFIAGKFKNNVLPNTPIILANFGLTYNFNQNISLFTNSRYVGKQYLDNQNHGKINPYFLMDFGVKYSVKNITLNCKINNIFDTLYSTYGYGYEYEGYHAYYWPGATRNGFFSLSYSL